jgi:mRNA (guanine-N7-)-methyltransferase
VRQFLTNVSERLVEGGIFVATTLDATTLVTKLRQEGVTNSDHPYRFGNQFYSVQFLQSEFRKDMSPYGIKYMFYLEESVGHQQERTGVIEFVPEYLVIMENFISLASEYRLKLEFKKNFHQYYEEVKNTKKDLFKVIVKEDSIRQA